MSDPNGLIVILLTVGPILIVLGVSHFVETWVGRYPKRARRRP